MAYPEIHAQKQDRLPGLETEMHPQAEFIREGYKGSGKLAGKVALVSGGDSGIGRAAAVHFAREGANVAIMYLDEHEDADNAKRMVEAEGRRCLLLPGDIRDSRHCTDAVEQTVKTFGRLDVLVNNAGRQEVQTRLEDITDEQWEKTFATNIHGYFYMARAALRHMKRGSVIINTGSVTGLQGSAELLDYSATKGAIHTFTKSLAQNLVPRGIRVNCVAPGPVWTPLNVADRPAAEVAEFGADTPMERPGQPEEIAPAFVFFASDADSSYITGEVLALLGGETTAG